MDWAISRAAVVLGREGWRWYDGHGFISFNTFGTPLWGEQWCFGCLHCLHFLLTQMPFGFGVLCVWGVAIFCGECPEGEHKVPIF